MKYLKLTPLDTLFFRDGRPFNAGETGQMEVGSVFPPSANTVVGCLRAAFARELGWDGRGSWHDTITEKLGEWRRSKSAHLSRSLLTQRNRMLISCA